MASVSLVVIARDEEVDLPGCLASVPFATETIVVDSGSRDRTREVARAAGARVLEQPWLGYGPQKAFAFQQAATEWILNLDADERLTPALSAEIPAALERADIAGYRLRYRSEMFGRTLRFGGLGHEVHLRLFRRDKGHVAERTIHEGVEVDGRVETLSGRVLHRSYASYSEYLTKLDAYTTLAAQARFDAGRRFHPLAAARLPWAFFRRYVLQLGFLDGFAGFTHAALAGFYDFLKEAKLQDLERPALPRTTEPS
jgi:glycosyltransferase involved in cell wall biosynthesis